MSTDWEAVRLRFDGNRLRGARELRRLTQAGLARTATEVGHISGLTAAAVSQFEVGEAVPSPPTLEALVRALEVPPEFLCAAPTDDELDLPAFFRSLRATPARERKRARSLIQLVHRLAVVLDGHVVLPARTLPSIPCDPFDDPEARRQAAEAAAKEVRRAWKIKRGPISNIVGVLESHGVVCTQFRLDDHRIDAFSVNFSDHPVAVLGADKDKWDRSRFDAAHELGHLVMHDEAAGVPEVERQANEFAAAFLLPARDIHSHLPARADWRQLMELKSTWGVSMAALLMRARTLEVMVPSTYVSATKVMSARGWRRHEPVAGTPELPTMLSDALARAKKAGHTPESLRREASIPADLFAEICRII